jgi:hypothetical protein
MTRQKHTHKYIRITAKHSFVWKCALEGCNHFVYGAQDYIVEGRQSICWNCGQSFVLDRERMKQEMPHCIDCTGIEVIGPSDRTQPVSQPVQKPVEASKPVKLTEQEKLRIAHYVQLGVTKEHATKVILELRETKPDTQTH